MYPLGLSQFAVDSGHGKVLSKGNQSGNGHSAPGSICLIDLAQARQVRRGNCYHLVISQFALEIAHLLE